MPMKISREEYDKMSHKNKNMLKAYWNLFGFIPTGEELYEALRNDPGLRLLVQHVVKPHIHKIHLETKEDYQEIMDRMFT